MEYYEQCHIDKLVFGGYGLGRVAGKVVMVHNALPGETVSIQVIQKKKDYAEAVAVHIITPSPHRIEPIESHFLSCSSWQCLQQDHEAYWKKIIAQETFQRIADIDWEAPYLAESPLRWHYRNKIEFHFLQDQKQLKFALMQKGSHRLESIPSCILAAPALSQTAQAILDCLNHYHIQANQLKRLTIRGTTTDLIWAGLTVQNKNFPKLPFLNECPSLNGIEVGQWHPHEHIKRLYCDGISTLEENVNGVRLSYGPNSFFQIHRPLLETVISDLGPYVQGESIVDYYGGVGTLGLSLAKMVREGIIVEKNGEAVQYAEKNLHTNHFTHFSTYRGKTEELLHFIETQKVILVDPPRSGLDWNTVQQLLVVRPKRIIYLSCNLSTCARDIKPLLSLYQSVFYKLYNFFPMTPHIEGLVVLER